MSAVLEHSTGLSTWPHFVPRIELDVHLKAIQDNLDEAFRRLNVCDQRGAGASADIETLQNRCKELAGKVDLNSLASRLDLQVSCCQAELVDGLAEVREYATAEAGRVCTELEAQLQTLGSNLSATSQHGNRLEQALEEARTYNATTYVSQEGHQQSVSMMQLAQETLSGDLERKLAALEKGKASRTEMNNLKEALRDSEARLGKDLSAATIKLDRAASDLADLENTCRGLAPLDRLEEVANRVTDLQKQARAATENQLNIMSQLDFERERIVNTMNEVQQNWNVLNDSVDSIRHLRVSRTNLTEKLDNLEQDLITLGKREDKHWTDCQQEFEAKQKAHADLQGFYEQLRSDFTSHTEAQRLEGDRLKQHSTMRYLDQIDKALALDHKLTRVDKGHTELQETMRNLKLPKV
mmetsp:Transcript_99083/g.171766  ORF Transcript_99083/g.171766 Transcript_99083/m.171766 type:complete len:411 (+) Transcript_99083:44-1276(+)